MLRDQGAGKIRKETELKLKAILHLWINLIFSVFYSMPIKSRNLDPQNRAN
jgi:hypothetical protein